jgi:hypothetical protein
MSTRERVFEDPLSMGMCGEDEIKIIEKKEVKPLVVEETLKTLDSSKINIKGEKKKYISPVLQSDNNNKVNKSILPEAEIGNIPEAEVGNIKLKKIDFSKQNTGGLWDNEISKPKVDILSNFEDAKDDDDTNIFADIPMPTSNTSLIQRQVTSPMDDIFAPRKDTSVINTGILDDKDNEKVSDMNISNLLNVEENLDYDIFGKKQVTKGKPKPNLLKTNKDDFLELTSEALLSTLEVTLDDKPSETVFKFDEPIVNTNATKEYNIESMDISAYIAQQEADDEGGLFD